MGYRNNRKREREKESWLCIALTNCALTICTAFSQHGSWIAHSTSMKPITQCPSTENSSLCHHDDGQPFFVGRCWSSAKNNNEKPNCRDDGPIMLRLGTFQWSFSKFHDPAHPLPRALECQLHILKKNGVPPEGLTLSLIPPGYYWKIENCLS